MIRNSAERWGWISIGLHWLTAVLIICLAIVGLIMSELPTSAFKMQVFAVHKSFGITVLALTTLRLAWRLVAGTPSDIAGPRLQALAAKIVHGAMYGILFAMPLSGWLYNSASGFSLRWFGLVSLPKLFTGFNPSIKAFALNIHESLFYVLAGLLLVHAGAALYHHYRIGDNTLTRMLGKTK
jgi:cytochrome b561